MIKHVVMWCYKDKNDINVAKELLEQMRNKIPAVLNMEVGVNFNDTPAAYDLVLCTTHRDKESLENYQKMPLHMEIKAKLGTLESVRSVVDYEIPTH